MATTRNETELVEILFGESEEQKENLVTRDQLKTKSTSQRQLFPPNFEYIVEYYDMMVILIALFDSILKHYIMYLEFSQNIAWFVFSTYLLSLTHICGATSLMNTISNTVHSSKICKCVWVFVSIPLCVLVSPFAPFIQYVLRYYHSNSKLSQALNALGLYVKPPLYDIEYEKKENKSCMNFYRWQRIIKYRHKGFLIQTCISIALAAFQCGFLLDSDSDEQCLLHCILYYISITISVASITLKCMVWQIRNTVFLQSYWFNFLITMYDCTGILLMFLIFYSVIFSDIASLYFVWITSAPYIMSYVWTYVHITHMSCCKKVLMLFASAVALPFWSLFLCLLCFTMIMMQIDLLFQTRFKYNEYDVVYWSKMRTFISQSTDEQDTIKRICSINLEIFHFNKYNKQLSDNSFEDYLNNAEELDLFETVTCCSLVQQNVHPKNRMVSVHPMVTIFFPFLNDYCFWLVRHFDEYTNNWKYACWIPLFLDCLITFSLMLGSCLFYGAKVLQLCWPIFLLCLSYIINEHTPYGVDVYLLLILYLVFSIVVVIKFIQEIRIYRWFDNILPFATIPNIDEAKSVTFHEKKIYEYYTELIDIPIREQILIDIFGSDVGCIINEYNGRFQQIELQTEIEQQTQIEQYWD